VFLTDVAISSEIFEIKRAVFLLFFISYERIRGISSACLTANVKRTLAALWTSSAALTSSATRSFSATDMSSGRIRVNFGVA